jgi:N-acetylglucosamine-6-sulfatase
MLAAVLVSLLAMLGYDAPGEDQQETPPPNVLYIVLDDADAEVIERYMPTVRDRIKNAGAEFTNFYVAEPQCCPSRVSALLGEYPHVHQVERNTKPEGEAKYRSMGHEPRAIGPEMQDRGYTTGLIGKYLNGYTNARKPPGWNRWFAKFSPPEPYFDWYATNQNKVEHFGTEPKAYSDAVIMKMGTTWTSTTPEPFYLYLAPTGPHTPHDDPPGYENRLTSTSQTKTPAYNEGDVSDKPSFIRHKNRIKAKEARTITQAHKHRARKAAMLDHKIATLLNALEARGKLENTYIIFTSDNGYMEGEHRLRAIKAFPYEESTHLPLYISGPDITPGTKVDALVSNVDFYATVTDIQGEPELRDGRSLLPLATGDIASSEWPRESILTEGVERGPKDYNMVRTGRYKYIEYHNGEKELYDLQADPYELESFDETADPVLLARLHSIVEELATCEKDSCRVADQRQVTGQAASP